MTRSAHGVHVLSTWMLALLTTSLGCVDPADSGGIEDAAVEANPGCAISCVVRWTTSIPATSFVEFGPAGSPTHRIGDAALVTDHEVVVVGMNAGDEVALQAVSTTESGEQWRSEELSFAAGELPYDWMAGEVDIDEPGLRQPGWTLANVCTGVFCPTVVVLLDEAGQPVWFHVGDEEGRADVEPTWVDGGGVVLGPGVAGGESVVQVDLQGRVTWQGPTQPDLDTGSFLDLIADGLMHHTFHPAKGGGYITALFEVEGDVIGDVIWQFDEGLETTFSWNAFDHMEVDPDTIGLLGEWTHVNSIAVDPDEDVVYVNSWNLDAVFKLSREDGSILWQLGQHGDFAADPTAEYPWFDGAHGLEDLGDDRFLLYDNGGGNRLFSRLVEYQLDTDAMTATLVWEYPGEGTDDDWYNYSWGDVDPLPNGNRLMAAGNGSQGYDRSRLQEVTVARDIAWRMWWPMGDDVTAGSFYVQRIPALAEPL